VKVGGRSETVICVCLIQDGRGVICLKLEKPSYGTGFRKEKIQAEDDFQMTVSL